MFLSSSVRSALSKTIYRTRNSFAVTANFNAPNGTNKSSPNVRVGPIRVRSTSTSDKDIRDILDKALQTPAGPLYGGKSDIDSNEGATLIQPELNDFFIPQVELHDQDRGRRKRVLVLCTGGTLTMAPDPNRGGALAPVQGTVPKYMKSMNELCHAEMPEVVVHEYNPLLDSSDLGPNDWAVLASDIKANYWHFDGFVILTGTDTMAYTATALSFMLENLNKPVVFTGSQIPLCEPYNDARRNLIMSLIFAARDSIPEVCIFFHDRLLRACRATKTNTHRLKAFDSPNMEPLAKIGIAIDENKYLSLPQPRGAMRVHAKMDTRLLTIRLVPGFDDEMIRQLINGSTESNALKVLVLQLYGTGNIPSVKKNFVQLLADAVERDVLVVASTQCHTGSVMIGHYATGLALREAGVVSANDMTLEAVSCKAAYLLGRGDLTTKEVANIMDVSLRGEVTPSESLSPPPLSNEYKIASRRGRTFY